MPITVGTDSYISLADANTYLASFGPADAVLTTEEALKRATKVIDRLYRGQFIGSKTDDAQPLEWPRSGDTTIPAVLGEATAEIAYSIESDASFKPYAQPSPLVKKESVEVDVVKTTFEYANGSSGTDPYYAITVILAPVLSTTGSGGIAHMDVVLA
jgi:hypothetical protein